MLNPSTLSIYCFLGLFLLLRLPTCSHTCTHTHWLVTPEQTFTQVNSVQSRTLTIDVHTHTYTLTTGSKIFTDCYSIWTHASYYLFFWLQFQLSLNFPPPPLLFFRVVNRYLLSSSNNKHTLIHRKTHAGDSFQIVRQTTHPLKRHTYSRNQQDDKIS